MCWEPKVDTCLVSGGGEERGERERDILESGGAAPELFAGLGSAVRLVLVGGTFY